jgi:predicted nucleic acid-binding protein
MRAVDTNVLVHLVTRDDRKQVAAAESFVSKGAWLSALVLLEATWVLTAVYDLTGAESGRVRRFDRSGETGPRPTDHTFPRCRIDRR